MSYAARSLLAWAVFAAISCQALPEIEPGVCGNAVIEAGETCDGFGRGESECRPPGAAGQCQLDCSPREDGSRPACPSGWGCDEARVCRKATGGYRAFGTPTPGNAFTLIAGDFDGDGRSDVLSAESPGELGASKARVHFFERDGELARSWISSRTLASWAVARISDDPRSDVVFADGRVGVLLGEPDRSLLSATYPTYFLPDAALRIAGPLHDDPVGHTPPLLVISDEAGELTIMRPNEDTGGLSSLARRPGRIADLAGDPVVGDVFAGDPEDPCMDTLIAVRGESEASVYSVCTGGGQVKWLEQAQQRRVSLSPAAAIESGPLLADLDGDGHLDVLLGTGGGAYVAYGDGRELAPARPWIGEVEAAEVRMRMPLAAADWNGDGRADLVYPAKFLLSQPAAEGGRLAYHNEATRRFGADYRTALIVDLNGNGLLDVIGASDNRLDIDFFNGTGSDVLNRFVIPTERPVGRLAIGDFDGDLLNDLAFTQLGAAAQGGEVMVAFGERSGPPISRVTAARAGPVMQLGAMPTTGALSELFVAYTQADQLGREGAAMAWLTGFDRSLMCLVELTTFATTGQIESMPALHVTLGSFGEPGRIDALLVGSDLLSNAVTLWSMPALGGSSSWPQRLGWEFDARLSPLRGAPDMPALELLSAAGDLDGDGIDELVFAAPDERGEHCNVVRASLAADGGSVEQRGELVELTQACARAGQLEVADLDGDGAAEIVLLSAAPGGERELLALWNDGSGQFSADSLANLAQGEVPQAFTLFRSTPRAPLRLAYVTEDRLRLFELTSGSRELEQLAGVPELELEHATGIAAGDVDGDGIADLMLADGGAVRLLRAALEP